MVITNALLSFGFCIVSNFASVLQLPSDAVPQRVEDLREFTVGDPHSPIDLHMSHIAGTMFSIRDGAVYMYEAPGSYSHLQNPDLLPSLLGEAKLSAQQVTALATRTIERLVTRGATNPIANIKPSVESAGKLSGEQIPFYEISWPKSASNTLFAYHAGIEIDARSGKITRLELRDPAFCNEALAREIRDKAWRPDPPRTNLANPHPRQRIFPMPTTNQVAEATASWLWLCDRLGITPGSDTNLATVNWDRTFLWTNRYLPSAPLECTVEFQNGANFCAISGVALSHAAPDAWSVGDQRRFTQEQWEAFKGPINKDWKALAENVEHALTQRLLIPNDILRPYRVEPPYAPAPLGTIGFKRANLRWTNPTNIVVDLGRDAPLLGYGAEVDLQTGKTVEIGFADPRIIEAIARAQGKELRFPSPP